MSQNNEQIKQKPSFAEYSDEDLNYIFEDLESKKGIKKQLAIERKIDSYYYNELRNSGRYTEAESVNGRFEDMLPENYSPSKGVKITKDDWIWHEFDNGCKKLAKDRISLSVKADRKMLEELDQLLLTGKYKDKNGNIITIPKDKFTKGFYKTDTSLNSWCTRHDPITMYFDEKISPEMLKAIAEITEKYKRIPQREMIGAVEGKPWIAHEASITPSEIQQLVAEAEKVDKDLAFAIKDYLGDSPSTGEYNYCVKMLEDYKRYKNNNSNQATYSKTSGEAIQQSQNFNKTNKINVNEAIKDGYKDGGRDLEFDNNGSPMNSAYREIIVVDRTRDVKLQSWITNFNCTEDNKKREGLNLLFFVYYYIFLAQSQ